ncbi:hypothetical protein [Vibrio parahaemolyticus]|uniref:hypothetical protein n=1 Tax=Vibrio parahaemolyticus TaxID=670 RepID=UPI001FABF201|nr:hypothetical protein [Vibrio parahaemolyticus]MCI9689802.1 hypothetical protein [Vibrio parahaemolyticus]
MTTREYMVEGDLSADRSGEAYRMEVYCDKAAEELGLDLSEGTVVVDGVCQLEDCECHD